MSKLFREILGCKKIALLIIVGTVVLSLYAFYFNGRANENVHSQRFDYGKIETKENIQKSLEEAITEYDDLMVTASADSRTLRKQREKILVLKELLGRADEVKISELYEGMKADQQDACAFIAESFPLAALLTVLMAIFSVTALMTRTFDEGVYIYIYYTSRTKTILKCAAVIIISTVAAYLWFGGFILLVSKAFPEIHRYGLIVTADRAFIIDTGVYTGVYVFARYFFISVFAALVVILAAAIAKKSLPVYGISAAVIGAYYALKYVYPKPLAFLGLCGEEFMYFFSKTYFDLTPLYSLVIIALIIMYLRLVFEHEDL